MIDEVKFIDTVFLKENTTITDNVDDNLLVPYIYKAQDTHLQQALGTTFYNHLKQSIIDGTTTVDERALIIGYIQKMVAEWALYEVLPFINYKLTNKSLSKERSEYSNNSELNELKYIRQTVRDMAEFYTKRLTNHLNQNCELYPKYNDPDNPENLRKSNKSYYTGIFIPKRKYK